jgi:hypothetical protein
MSGRLIVLIWVLIVGLADAPGVLAQEASPVPTAITLPAPTGPQAVGRTGFEWIDRSRDEPFTDDPADHRELVIWMWYPR